MPDTDPKFEDLPPDQQIALLKRRLERAEKSRQEAETLLEKRARELHRINRDLHQHEQELQQRLNRINLQLLAAQRIAKIATVYRARGSKFHFSSEINRIWGYPIDSEPDPYRIMACVHPLDRKRVQRQEFDFYTTLAPNESHGFEHRIVRHSDRKVRWVRWTLRRDTDELGRFICVRGTVQDITDQRFSERQARAMRLLAERRVRELSQLTKELEQSNARAEQASRSKSQFLAMMSHDIRTPMNGVLGMLANLAETELNPSQRRQLEIARRSGGQLNVLLNDIIEIVRAEAGKIELQPEPVSLRQTVQGIVDFWRESDKSQSATLQCNIAEDLPETILIDPTRLRQLIDNLVSNALKYAPGGLIRVSALKKGSRLRIEVQDSGPGIAETELSRLFVDFSRLSTMTIDPGQSAGLGLAICRRLVEAMDGRIGLDSRLGKGCTFWFELPLIGVVSFQSGNSADVATPAELPDDRSVKVLIAEDVLTNQQVLAGMLDTLGVNYEIVSDGADALEAVKNSAFDLVLMDVSMPVLDGIEATKAIRALPSPACEVPIIGVTAHVLHGTEEELLSAGMNDYVAKPVDMHGLAAAISRATYGDIHTAHARVDEPLPLMDAAATADLFSALSQDRRNAILAQSIEDMDRLCADLDNASQSGDTQAMARAAHSLKGIAGNIGAIQLSALVAEGVKLDAEKIKKTAADTAEDIRGRFGLEGETPEAQ